ncbi:helix-turn-helix transcriptional regulator [Virgisporangium aurantiacum]|uniref:XRE family transcriptional regulator n=1 Tax=Virgisporangium aurantiacum TaxID=175570 RepID=A0A8J3ZJT7_9ACTN|nr:helix-turn-helix transcriptional regulator [Virgisporangium aurantiacum]GIJ62810.1 hypothetical protein Vau01_103260 [Virgisporangium aurantiacum]
MDGLLLQRLAAHRGVAVPVEEHLPAAAEELGWRLTDLLAISGSAIPAELMPADPTAKRQIRNLLEKPGTLTADELASVRAYARSLPAAPEPRGQTVPPVDPITFGTALWRLMLVRNLNIETVCRVIGWPMVLLSRLVQGQFPPKPEWLRYLGDVLDLRPDDLAAIAGVPASSGEDAAPLHRTPVGGLVLDLIPLSAEAIDQLAYRYQPRRAAPSVP